jgi:TusA-related sulfurtransferase
VLFTRGSGGAAESSTTPVASAAKQGSKARSCTGTPVIEVDARGLEPPQPLVKILEALASLPQGARLRARTDRRPMHLYAQLEERGFVGESEEQKDGSFVTLIRQVADERAN